MSSLSLSLAQLGCATIDSPSRIAVVDEVSDLLPRAVPHAIVVTVGTSLPD